MAQGILYYLPHKGIFRIKCENRITDISVDKSEIARGSFSSALEDALESARKLSEPLSVDFLLPHFMYGVDFITLPNVKRGHVEDAYKAQLKSAYKNYDDLIFRKTEISTGKTVTFRVIFVRRSLMNALKEGFAKFNINIEKFIPQGVALIEGAVRLEPAVKKAPCLILNIGEDESYMAAYSSDTLIGGIPIPFGLRALADNRLVYEKQLFHRDAAELLVINARERAKSTKLTMAIDLEEEIDDTIPDDDEIIEQNPELPDLTKAGSDELDDQEVQTEDDDEEMPAIKTLRKSAIRVLPKFMRREEPTTPQGYVIENFRMFEKRVLMLIRDMSLYEYYPKLENIFIALPAEYKYIIEAMKTENPSLKWAYIGEYDEELTISGALRVSGMKAVVF